jgi:hypothetical protein
MDAITIIEKWLTRDPHASVSFYDDLEPDHWLTLVKVDQHGRADPDGQFIMGQSYEVPRFHIPLPRDAGKLAEFVKVRTGLTDFTPDLRWS